MSLDIYYDKDCDLSIIKKKKVAVLGYGSQGRAHALNLHDSGVDVVVGLRPDSSTNKKVKADGLESKATADAVKGAALFVRHDLTGRQVFILKRHPVDCMYTVVAAFIQTDAGLAGIGH